MLSCDFASFPKNSLREELQKYYQLLIEKNKSSLTAAPFFSLKTETIKSAIFALDNASWFDLRESFSLSFLPKDTGHVFLDSVEGLGLGALKNIIDTLSASKKTPHLIAHLYYYEKIKDLIPNATTVFPQLLNGQDLFKIKTAYKNASFYAIVNSLIDNSEGWPIIAHLLCSRDKSEVASKLFASIAQQAPNQNPLPYLRLFVKNSYKPYFNFLKKNAAIAPDLNKIEFKIPANGWNDYRARKIDLKQLAENSAPQTWHFVKFGFLWLDEERQLFKVPKLLAEICDNEKE